MRLWLDATCIGATGHVPRTPLLTLRSGDEREFSSYLRTSGARRVSLSLSLIYIMNRRLPSGGGRGGGGGQYLGLFKKIKALLCILCWNHHILFRVLFRLSVFPVDGLSRPCSGAGPTSLLACRTGFLHSIADRLGLASDFIVQILKVRRTEGHYSDTPSFNFTQGTGTPFEVSLRSPLLLLISNINY